MTIAEFLAERLRLRRAAIGQISGVDLHALDKFMEEKQTSVLGRRDERIAWLAAKRDDIRRRSDENA